MNRIPQVQGSITRLTPNQINLRAMFSVELILKSRGYEIKKKGELSELLIPTMKFGDDDYNLLLQCFDDKNSRKEVLDFIKTGNKPCDNKAKAVVFHKDFVKKEQVFTKTFEWYIGEAMVGVFQGFSFAFGVDISNVLHNQSGRIAGDYDTLVVNRNLGFLYFECKTGSFDHDHIQKAIDRAIALNCESVIIVTFNIIEKYLVDAVSKAKHPLLNTSLPLSKVEVKSNSESMVYEWHNCYFINFSKDFVEQMKTVLRLTEAKRVFMQYATRPDKDELAKMGYEVKELEPTQEVPKRHFSISNLWSSLKDGVIWVWEKMRNYAPKAVSEPS